MRPNHDDRESPGVGFRRGKPGDVRRGTVYGRTTAHDYNKAKVVATEADEGRRVVLLWFARRLKNDDKICEFVVINGSLDPGMKVMSRVKGTPIAVPLGLAGDPALGTLRSTTPDILQEWRMIEEDGRYVFHAPDGYDGGPIAWLHRPDLGDEALVYGDTFWNTGGGKLFYDVGASFSPPLLGNDGVKQDVGMTEVPTLAEVNAAAKKLLTGPPP